MRLKTDWGQSTQGTASILVHSFAKSVYAVSSDIFPSVEASAGSDRTSRWACFAAKQGSHPAFIRQLLLS
jgi:hypothetical protein